MNRLARWVALLFTLLALACHREGHAPLRLGSFPNLTHAQALVGVRDGTFSRALGGSLEAKTFNAGPAAMEALMAGAVDVCYVGSGPAITAFIRSNGAIRVIAGSASGGSVLVARTARRPADLAGKSVATPQIGNSQDIALRNWLRTQGLDAISAGGTVQVIPQANPEILALFRQGQIEAAWVPEPWASRLIVEGGGHVLVDERTLWPRGEFPTTVLVATTDALNHRRAEVKRLLQAHVELTERARRDPHQFAEWANDAFAALTGKAMRPDELFSAMSRLELTIDPLPAALSEVGKHAAELGYVPPADLSGLVDRSLLDEVLRERRPTG